MIVIFDSNIWIAELGLGSPAGAAVRFFIRQSKASVALPAVVRLETEENLVALLDKACSDIRKSHGRLLSLFGKLKEVVLPTEAEIRHKAGSVFDDLDVPCGEIPFTQDAAQRALMMTVRKQAPSDRDQQFKDCVIWVHCVDLLASDDVHLVSADKAFYSGRDYNKGLAKNLLAEASAATHAIEIHPNLGSLLSVIGVEVDVDHDIVAKLILERREEDVEAQLAELGFAGPELKSQVVNLFATEAASSVYFEYQFVLACEDATNQERVNVELRLEGDGTLDTEKSTIIEIRPGTERVTYLDKSGEVQKSGKVHLQASIGIGHKSVRHSVRFPLDEAAQPDDAADGPSGRR